MAHRSVGHPVGFAIVLQLERRRHLDGPHLRAMTIEKEKAPDFPAPFLFVRGD